MWVRTKQHGSCLLGMRRKNYILLAAVLTVYVVYTVLQSRDEEDSSSSKKLQLSGDLLTFDTNYSNRSVSYGNRTNEIKKRSICELPKYEPLDPSVRRFIKHLPPLKCGSPQPALTSVGEDGILIFDSVAAHVAKLSLKKLRCVYQEVQRSPNNDEKVTLGPEKALTSPMAMPAPFVLVHCYKGKKLVYQMGHTHVHELSDKKKAHAQKAAREGAVNLLLLGFDSVSRLNFMRQLPKSHTVLTQQLGATVLRGLNKVADNTYPNMISFLAGLNANRYGKLKPMGPEWSLNRTENRYVDGIPLVWKNFSDKGYVTLFSEDCPELATFNVRTKGFKDPPTDYYMRPYWLAMQASMNYKALPPKHEFCFHEVAKHKIFFDYTERFVQKMQRDEQAFMAYSFLTGYSHNNINTVQMLDDALSSLLLRLLRGGVLKNTLLMVFGDHGIRFGDILRTPVGHAELSLPYVSVTLPRMLAHLKPGLQANEHSLLSWYDMHEMLLDVLTGNLGVHSRQLRLAYRGLSPLRPVPRDRTCEEVGVPLELCMCLTEGQPVDTADRWAQGAAEALVVHVNSLVSGLDSGWSNCAHLSLGKVLSARQMLEPGSTRGPRLLVTLVAQPSGAELEALMDMEVSKRGEKFVVIGDVTRINSYGEQSACVEERTLKLYCYCLNWPQRFFYTLLDGVSNLFMTSK